MVNRLVRAEGNNSEADRKRFQMKTDLINEITSTYQKHGWELKSVLLRPDTAAELLAEPHLKSNKAARDSAIDALWFSRPSHNRGEAWELRLLAETPYALFQRFEAGVPESERAKILQEMEERMIQYVSGL